MKYSTTFGTDNSEELKTAVGNAGLLMKDTGPISYRYSDAKPFKVVTVGTNSIKLAKTIDAVIAPYHFD